MKRKWHLRNVQWKKSTAALRSQTANKVSSATRPSRLDRAHLLRLLPPRVETTPSKDASEDGRNDASEGASRDGTEGARKGGNFLVAFGGFLEKDRKKASFLGYDWAVDEEPRLYLCCVRPF